MEIKQYLIAILVFGVIVTGFWTTYVDLGDKYGVTPDAEYVEAYSNISSTMNATRHHAYDIRDDVRTTDADQDDDFGGSLIKGAYNSLRLIWNSFTSVNSVSVQIQEKIGIPGYFRTALLAIIIILISFAIISAVFKHPL